MRAAALKHAGQWLEIGIHSLFVIGLLLLVTGLFYPLYLLWPFGFSRYWYDRPAFLLELLPLVCAFLTLYLLGCWLWLRSHHAHSHPFRDFWLGRHLALSLGGMLWVNGLSLISRTAGRSWPLLSAVVYGLSLLAACLLLGAWLSIPRQRLRASSLWLALVLVSCQTLGLFLLLPQAPLALLLLALSLLLIPALAYTWPAGPVRSSGSPWQVFLAAALAGFCVMAGTGWWSWAQLAPEPSRLTAQVHRLQTDLRFERAVLRGEPLPGNGYTHYAPLFGRESDGVAPLFQIVPEDGDRIRQMFDLYTGRLTPDPEMLARYRPQVRHLQQALRHGFVHVPAADAEGKLGRMPEPGLMQDLSLLLMADALSRCEAGKCLAAAEGMLDALRLLQDLAVHGHAVPVMVSYKMERILLSGLGQRLLPQDLSPAQWRQLLAQWRQLLLAENAQFDRVLKLELLLAQQNLLHMLPSLDAGAGFEVGNPLEWLGLLPYISHGRLGLLALDAHVNDYLVQPVHAPQAWSRLIAHQKGLARQNPIAAQVLIDYVMLLQRYREHQVMLRGFYQYLALLAHAAEHNTYPEQLDALVPELLPVLPQDPYTGQPFRYRRSGADFQLYSLGENQKDDGGDGYYGHFVHSQNCSGTEQVFSPSVPEQCR
ncbi:MAG: hypothetical protein CVV27_05395 [Candidatus Melainabacteria bacterium HGW-Melainabacteria-1]|nr:MAG: hypothetical protein CVV27_05395 [Candidatus Melainabacteria bacterium HGW-Melainabacteria-1]